VFFDNSLYRSMTNCVEFSCRLEISSLLDWSSGVLTGMKSLKNEGYLIRMWTQGLVPLNIAWRFNAPGLIRAR
jgi:hypothetical protein